MQKVLISICIPAYKHPNFVRRLLESIQCQDFTDYEVIVTDDTPDDSVRTVCEDFIELLPLRYFQNNNPLGSPANWNEAISKAKGEWIKIMHGDDWFTAPDSLGQFANTALKGRSKFVFSAYYNCLEGSETKLRIGLTFLAQYLIKKSPFYLLRENYIGPPSTTLLHNSLWKPYNPSIKWIVDFEDYIRILVENKGEFTYLQNPLICIGIHANQVTSSCFLNPEIEIPENNLLATKYERTIFRNFFAYDYFWRLIRNLNIRDVSEFESYLAGEAVPPALAMLIQRANLLPHSIRAIGAISKPVAFLFWVEQLLRKPAGAVAQRATGQSPKH